VPSRFRQHEKSTRERAGTLCQTYAAPDCSVRRDRAIIAFIEPKQKTPTANGGGRSCHHQHGKRQLSLIVVLGLRFPCAVVTNRPEIALR